MTAKDDARTERVTPGLFDVQVNGFAGIDFNDAGITPSSLDHALEAMRRTGVTLCLPTIITAKPHELEARFAALDRAVVESRLGPAMCPGYHLEGPFLNPAEGYRGCHPPEAMTAADPALIDRLEAKLTRPILLVTLAPEVDGALALIAKASARGKLVAIGHSAATGDILRRAVAAGLKLSTHLGNGVLRTLHKFDNTLMAQLAEDGLSADGRHRAAFGAHGRDQQEGQSHRRRKPRGVRNQQGPLEVEPRTASVARLHLTELPSARDD